MSATFGCNTQWSAPAPACGHVQPLTDAELHRLQVIVLQKLQFADILRVDEPLLHLIYRLAACEKARRESEMAAA